MGVGSHSVGDRRAAKLNAACSSDIKGEEKIKSRTESRQTKQGCVWARTTEKETKDQMMLGWAAGSCHFLVETLSSVYIKNYPFPVLLKCFKILQCLIGILIGRCQSISNMTKTVLPNCYRSPCLKTNSWNKFYSAPQSLWLIV